MTIKAKAVSKVWTKKETQEAIKALRQGGYTVDKIDGGYVGKNKHGNTLFKAMNGNNGYLVRYIEDLFL